MQVQGRAAYPAVILLLVAMGWAACANPVPPSGGPRDEEPPSVVASDPARDAVNVPRDTEVRIEFSEYVERSSFVQALSVTPEFDGPLDFDWDGRAVTVEFPEALRENTTYILTLDNNLRDVRGGVSLDEPIRLAFATGPRLNRGQLQGRVIEAAEGQPVSDVDVYAYAAPDSVAPDSLPEQPTYRTQTNESGTFTFEYLREQPYYVIALQDNNRNRQPDPTEGYAAPPQATLVADSTRAIEGDTPWLFATPDTSAPDVQRARARSAARVEVQFDESVRLATRDPAAWVVADSVSGRRVTPRQVFRQASTPASVYVVTPSLQERVHRLIVPAGGVVDSVGNPVRADTVRFTPAARSDTVQTRFRTFTPANRTADTTDTYVLLPDEAPGVRFNQPITLDPNVEAIAALRRIVSVQDTAGQRRTFTATTRDGTTYRLVPDPDFRPGETVQVRVNARALGTGDSVLTRDFRRISDRELGGAEGVALLADTLGSALSAATPSGAAADTTSTAPTLVVEIIPVQAAVPIERRTATADTVGTFLFEGLPDGSYRFRAFLDRNGNGTWDAGSLIPYQAPEPIAWSLTPLETRPRWTNVLDDTLRVGQYQLPPSSAPQSTSPPSPP